MKQLYKFLKISWCDLILLLKTFLLLLAIRLGLWAFSFQKLYQLVQSTARLSSQNNQVPIFKLIWAVDTSSRYMPGNAKCLARALTTQALMLCHHYPADLRIGVAKGETGELQAHAWIESQGQVVIGNLPDLSRFVPLPSFQGV